MGEIEGERARERGGGREIIRERESGRERDGERINYMISFLWRQISSFNISNRSCWSIALPAKIAVVLLIIIGFFLKFGP